MFSNNIFIGLQCSAVCAITIIADSYFENLKRGFQFTMQCNLLTVMNLIIYHFLLGGWNTPAIVNFIGQ